MLSEPLSYGALRYIGRDASQFPDFGYDDRARRTRLMKLIGEPAWFGFHVANDCRCQELLPCHEGPAHVSDAKAWAGLASWQAIKLLCPLSTVIKARSCQTRLES